MAKSNKEDTRIRIHLLVSPETKALVDSLQERTGAGSMTEVIRRALSLYDRVSRKMAEGKELILRTPKTGSADTSETTIEIF